MARFKCIFLLLLSGSLGARAGVVGALRRKAAGWSPALFAER